MSFDARRLALFIILVLCLSMTGCGFITKLKARDMLNKGVKAFTEQKYPQAAEYFQRAIRLDPEFRPARMYLATAYSSQYIPGSPDPKNNEMADRAIAAFRDVLGLEKGGQNTDAMVAIASLNYQMKKYDESKDWCRKNLQVDPNNAEALYRIAVIDFDQSLKRTGLQGENVEFLKPEEKQETAALIEEGLKSLERALEIRKDYFDAMEYKNLLWREKAKFEKDEKAKNELIRQADLVAQTALQLKLKAQEEEAKKPRKLAAAK